MQLPLLLLFALFVAPSLPLSLTTPQSLSSLTSLLSGSDIRGEFGTTLTCENSSRIGKIFGRFVCECTDDAIPRVLIGRDPRVHGSDLTSAFSRGVISAGCVVEECGLTTTPSMFFAASTTEYSASCMTTASHLPAEKNGFKLFIKDPTYHARCLSKEEVRQLLADATALPTADTSNEGGSAKFVDFVPTYQAHLVDTFRKRTSKDRPLESLNIVLSTGSGSGFIVAPVLESLGAKVTLLNPEPDGTFPFGPPNPESKIMMGRTIDKCKEIGDVDLAILLDTDGDRCGVVLKGDSPNTFEEINRNRLIAFLSHIVCKGDNNATPKIVTDSVTSIGLETFIASRGGTQVRFKKGYLNVINEAKRRCKLGELVPLAVETSGHGAFAENNFSDDGTFTALLAASVVGEGQQAACLKGFEDAGYEEELRMETSCVDTHELCSTISDVVTRESRNVKGWSFDTENKEGIRITTDNKCGFFMIRPSLHDPVISLQVEAQTVEKGRGVVTKLRALMESALAKGDELNFKELDSMINDDGEARGW